MLTDVLGFIQHWIPAYVIDAVLRILGRKPFMVKAIGKVDAGIKSLEYFTSNEWVWDNDNSIELERELNGTDRECFDFRSRLGHMNWEEYFDNYFLMGRHQVCFLTIEIRKKQTCICAEHNSESNLFPGVQI